MGLINSISHFEKAFGLVTPKQPRLVAGDLALVGTAADLAGYRRAGGSGGTVYNFWHVTKDTFIGALFTNQLVLVIGLVDDNKLVVLAEGLVGRIYADYVTKLPSKPKRPNRQRR